jgi:isopenicillin N synthase-like dioxygenase
MTKKNEYELSELNFESTIGGSGELDENRTVPIIDMSDFENRKSEISDSLWSAATECGFFQLTNHSISLADIQQAFKISEAFFSLPKETKSLFPLKEGLNAGWEFRAQVRPSTGTADEKESYQFTIPHMSGLWPDNDQLSGFKSILEKFEYQAWQLNMQVLSCFALKLGFEEDFFANAHERNSDQYQSTLRLLHYLPMQPKFNDSRTWRAGAHTDFDCLTMVFQQENQGGLQVCPGKGAKESQAWTTVVPKEGVITCNIGDMLMRWSDDELLSTLHRVRMPTADESQGSRYSIAFFAQANKDKVIQGPKKKYPPITAKDYLLQRINANFAKES